MRMSRLSALAALMCEGVAEALHEVAVGLGGDDVVRRAERGLPIPGLGAERTSMIH